MNAAFRAGQAALALCAAPAAAQSLEGETIVVRGIVPARIETLAGSSSVLSAEELAAMAPITLKEALRRAPGVNVVDEDSFGLKLNISVRGLNPRRSGRTLLLEDGMPFQPAPYADPSAHYYPALSRVERIEFLRGAGQVLFGPQSVGGMINVVTRPAPREWTAEADISFGEGEYEATSLRLGGSGLALDLARKQGDGIRDGHHSRVDDAAVRWDWRVGLHHAFTLRASLAEEETRLTEAGLDQARFDISPYYNPFHHDAFVLRRGAVQLIHEWANSPGAALSTQAYFSDTFRASYRQTDTSVDRMVENVAAGCAGVARLDYERSAELCGNKMRPRDFRFWGIEPRLRFDTEVFGLAARTQLGVRAHVESTRRRRLDGTAPDAREETPGTRLRDDNAIKVAAYAAYGQSAITWRDWTFTPGARIEYYALRNEARTANFAPADRFAESETTIVMPGLGITRALGGRTNVFFGVHRGFAPPRPDRDLNPNGPLSSVAPEFSIEWEAGVRAAPTPRTHLAATVFDMELDDIIVEAQFAGGRSGAFTNAGRARHAGIEVEAGARLGQLEASFAYAFLGTAEFLSDASETAAGVRGARIPYAPRHSLDFALTYVDENWSVQWGANHVSEQYADARNTRAQSPDGLTGMIPARMLHRAAVTYRPVGAPIEAYVSVDNLFDETYIASRVDGIFAGPPRRAVFGLRFRQ